MGIILIMTEAGGQAPLRMGIVTFDTSIQFCGMDCCKSPEQLRQAAAWRGKCKIQGKKACKKLAGLFRMGGVDGGFRQSCIASHLIHSLVFVGQCGIDDFGLSAAVKQLFLKGKSCRVCGKY